jgi:hypothetical protein
MPLENQEKDDEKKLNDSGERVLKVGHNMYTSTINLRHSEPCDPMKTEPEETRGGRFYFGK